VLYYLLSYSYFVYLFLSSFFFFFFNDTATTEIYTLSLHDALPIWPDVTPTFSYPEMAPTVLALVHGRHRPITVQPDQLWLAGSRSEEHTSELQSLAYLVCRLLLEKKKKIYN